MGMHFWMALYEIFPESDSAVKDRGRIFFGGKSLIAEPNDVVIEPVRLFSSLYMYYGQDTKRKLSDISDFCHNMGIEFNNKYFGVDTLSYNAVKNLETPILYNHRDGQIFSDEQEIFVVHKSMGCHSHSSKEDETHKYNSDFRVKNVEFKKVYEKCRLWRKFESSERWTFYNEIWGMLTNISHINGGLKYFRQVIDKLKSKPVWKYNYEKWYSNITQMSKMMYGMSSCNRFCP